MQATNPVDTQDALTESEPFEIRSVVTRREISPTRRLLVASPGILSALAWGARLHSWTTRILLGGGGVMLGLAVTFGALAIYGRMRLIVSDSTLALATPLRTRVLTRRGPISKIVQTEFAYRKRDQRAVAVWFLVNGNGDTVCRLYPDLWTDGDLHRLCNALGLEPEIRHGSPGAKALRREFAGGVPSWQAHLNASSMLIVVFIITAVIAAEGKL